MSAASTFTTFSPLPSCHITSPVAASYIAIALSPFHRAREEVASCEPNTSVPFLFGSMSNAWKSPPYNSPEALIRLPSSSRTADPKSISSFPSLSISSAMAVVLPDAEALSQPFSSESNIHSIFRSFPSQPQALTAILALPPLTKKAALAEPPIEAEPATSLSEFSPVGSLPPIPPQLSRG